MTADIVRAAITALERTSAETYALWIAALGTSAVVLYASWHAGAALGEWVGRAPWRRT